MNINIGILKDDTRYGKFDQVIDLLFCISSVIFAFSIPFQFLFTPWIAQWFFAVLIFKIYYILRNKENLISINIKDSIAILSLGLFGIWALASKSWSIAPEQTDRMVYAWLSSLLIVPAIYIFSCKRLPVTLMLKSYTLGCTSLIAYVLLDLLDTANNGEIFFYINPRLAIMNHIGSISYHHIYLGFIIAISIFISMKLFFEKQTKGYEKIYYVLHTILALSLLAIDNSRIIFIVLFVTILLFTVNRMNKNWKVILPVATLFSLIIIAFCVLPTRTSETINNIISNGNANDPRFEIWSALLPGVKDVPFLGYGYQAVDSVYANLYEKANCFFAKKYHYISHSQFIESYFNLGIVGLLLSIFILLGFLRMIKIDKTIISTGSFILLLISMVFDVPLFHCFVIPLLISWLAFCYSGKEDIEVKIPSKLYLIILPIVAGILIYASIGAYKAIKKYSSFNNIELSDYSQRKYTKKAIKKHQIKDENISLILSGLKTEFTNEEPDKLTETRYISLIKSTDSLICSFDYFISKDYDADDITMSINEPHTSQKHKINLSNRDQWVSKSIVIPPTVKYISTNAKGQKSIVYKQMVRTLTLDATNSRDGVVKGYAAFRNLKVEKK